MLRRFGRFVVDAEIGRGAWGVVLRGHDERSGVPVAVKIFERGGRDAIETDDGGDGDGDSEALARFRREAATAARLKHPDIVDVLDAGEAGGLAWIAMAYAPGDDLSRHTEPGRLLPWQQVLHIVERVARAVDHAHAQGVVHRDLKPANVRVDIDAGSGLLRGLKVMDFGVAHAAGGGRTRTGVLLGTPAYMSPQQLAGAEADARSDVYSLGAMLYELLTGHLPHEAGSMGALLQQIAREPAPDLRLRRPDLPAALADVVALALEKRAELRYAGAAPLADDLHHVAGTVPSTPLEAASSASVQQSTPTSRASGA